MPLTAKEQEVVGTLRRYQVATGQRLSQELDVSYWTLLRGLQKHGYYTSFNCNSAYYTLADTPAFDADGLWFFGQVGFSRHGTLDATLAALVERSPAGQTAQELEARLRTRVGNLLSRACQGGRLGRCRSGRQVVYLSPLPEQGERQQRRRLEQGQDGLRFWPNAGLPEGMDARSVILVLLQLIEQPRAGRAQQAEALRARGFALTEGEVSQVIEFYGLAKKGALSQWLRS